MDDLFGTGDISRRVFVKGLGLVSLALVMSTCGGCEQIIDKIKNRPVRRRLRTGSPEVDADIETYRQAVAAMKALPASDPRSWASQAAIHGTAGVGFNLCQHNTDHFFSWHRAYLVYFERICQELTGNKQFGLPYWNWNQDPDIHSAFLDSSSVLFSARNRISVSGHSSFSTSTLDTIFSDTNFFTFAQQIEGTPHNSGHTWIGGSFGGAGSATDPIFWAHHNMVDYCWAKWNLEMENNNTNDAGWSSTAWNHFVDVQGNQAEATAGATTLMPLISYRFESSAIGSSPATPEPAAEEFKKLEARIRKGADVKFDIKRRFPIAERTQVRVGRPFSKETRLAPADVASIINSRKEEERIFASVKFAQLPPVGDFFVRVFLNLPTATRETSIEDPHFAGTFAFFGTHVEGSHHSHEPRFLVNVTETIQRLRQRGDLKEDSAISVQLVAVPTSDKFERDDAELILNQIEIIVTPVIVKTQ